MTVQLHDDPYDDYALSNRAIRADVEFLHRWQQHTHETVRKALLLTAALALCIAGLGFARAYAGNRVKLETLIEAHPELFPEEEK
jgi:hypothetical protein